MLVVLFDIRELNQLIFVKIIAVLMFLGDLSSFFDMVLLLYRLKWGLYKLGLQHVLPSRIFSHVQYWYYHIVLICLLLGFSLGKALQILFGCFYHIMGSHYLLVLRLILDVMALVLQKYPSFSCLYVICRLGVSIFLSVHLTICTYSWISTVFSLFAFGMIVLKLCQCFLRPCSTLRVRCFQWSPCVWSSIQLLEFLKCSSY